MSSPAAGGGPIDARLRRFDLAGPDAVASYREFVRDMAGMGPAGRIGLALRAIWGFPSQRRLLFWAIVAALVGLGIGMLPENSVLSAIPPQAQMVSDWISNHAALVRRRPRRFSISSPSSPSC